jgi:hypothetical protein
MAPTLQSPYQSQFEIFTFDLHKQGTGASLRNGFSSQRLGERETAKLLLLPLLLVCYFSIVMELYSQVCKMQHPYDLVQSSRQTLCCGQRRCAPKRYVCGALELQNDVASN